MNYKKITLALNITVIGLWLVTGICVFLSGNVTKLQYGACWFILLMSWSLKTHADFRNAELYEKNQRLIDRYISLLNIITKSKKEDNDNEH